MVSALMILGSLGLVSGGLGYFMFPLGLSMGIKSNINLAESGMVYPVYMDPPFPTRSEYRLFAIKNPREVLRGAKMDVEVKGPYVYDVYLERDNVSFDKKGEKLRYDSHRKLYLDEEKSANLDEKMWVINPILPGTLKSVRTMVLDRIPFQRISEPVVLNAVNVLLDNYKERLIVRTTPRKLLDGRKIQLLEMLSSLAGRFGLTSILPPAPPQNVFGLAFVQNETVDPMEIWTGVGSSVEKFGDVSKWKGKTKVDAWKGKCSIINGTNGELYKPFIEEGKPLKVFLAPLCRSFTMDPVGDGGLVETSSGIKGYEYEITPKIFMGARSNPGNRCFCEDTRTYDCQFDGLLGMGPCFFDSPIFFSRGNLKGVDRRIRNTINTDVFESKPLSEKQAFVLEPITGTALRANITLLGLVKVVAQPYMRDLAKVRNLTYAPFFAATETIDVPFKYVWQIYFLQRFVDNYKPIMIGMAASGGGMILLKYVLF